MEDISKPGGGSKAYEHKAMPHYVNKRIYSKTFPLSVGGPPPPNQNPEKNSPKADTPSPWIENARGAT